MEPVKGTCHCKDSKDDTASGDCSESSFINSVQITVIYIFGVEIVFGILIALANKKIYLLIRFIDTCQQLSLLYYINMYYPSNIEVIWKVVDALNLRSYSLNLFKIFGRQSGIYSIDDDDLLDLGEQNSQTKFRLNNVTSSFICNSCGILLVYVLIIVVIRILKLINNFSKKEKLKVIEVIEENLPLLYIYLCVGDIALFIPLQLQNLQMEMLVTKISMAALILVVIVLLAKFVSVLRIAHSWKQKDSPANQILYLALSNNLKREKYPISPFYHAVGFVKKFLLSIFVAAFYRQSTLQILSLLTCQSAYTLFVIRYQSLERRY